GNHSVECDIIASIPYGADGPRLERPGFYEFTSEAAGDVVCTGVAFQIKMNVVYQHATNGIHGAEVGRDVLCEQERRCNASRQYRRQRLNCFEYYEYDDYGQVTAWYKRDTNAPEVRISKESRHKIGNSHLPDVCR